MGGMLCSVALLISPSTLAILQVAAGPEPAGKTSPHPYSGQALDLPTSYLNQGGCPRRILSESLASPLAHTGV